jgi:hypothetical protein
MEGPTPWPVSTNTGLAGRWPIKWPTSWPMLIAGNADLVRAAVVGVGKRLSEVLGD